MLALALLALSIQGLPHDFVLRLDLDGDGTADFTIGVGQLAYGTGYVKTFVSGL